MLYIMKLSAFLGTGGGAPLTVIMHARWCICNPLLCDIIVACAGCEDDVAVVEWLVKQHRVCVIFGSSCGAPGYIRAAFANMELADCQEAAARLKRGLQQLVMQGPAALTQSAAVPS